MKPMFVMTDLKIFKLAESKTISTIKQIENEDRDGSDSYLITFETGEQLKLTTGFDNIQESSGLSINWLNPNEDE